MGKYRIATAVAVSMAIMQVLANAPPASTSKPAPTAQAQRPAPSSPQQSTAVDPAELAKLGTIQFPTSGSPEAQTHFLRGMAALHSFWYPVALAEFRQSTKIDPDFMMGYWGEAMAHNHPIWGDPQDTEAARKVLEKIRITPELTERERAYLQAVQVLYGKADQASRDRAYAAAMEKIHREYPNDEEARLFYALSLLGMTHHDRAIRLRAGAIASEVFRQNPNHPGAAHYVIHAYDDPKHARQALDAARRYAALAPAVPHAQHMPAHIFLQLGMWREAAAANEAALKAARKQGTHPVSMSDQTYHSLHWLNYIYLQQGRYEDAKELLAQMRKALTETSPENSLQLYYFAYLYSHMAAAFIVESERWDLAEESFQPLQILAEAKPPGTASAEGRAPPSPFIQAALVSLQALPIFVRGLVAAKQASGDAEKSMAELQAIAQRHNGAQEGALGPALKLLKIQRLELSAVSSASKDRLNAAIEAMQKATVLADSLPPPSGPPEVIKPSYELFGEILWRAERPKEAAAQFAAAMSRQPNRARALLGEARAIAMVGNTRSAAEAYAQLSRQWQQADAQQPELLEAQEYMNRVSAR